MPGFPLLDTAIGLIFVYLLVSLICSSINEGLETLLRNRANDLERGIRNLLSDDDQGGWWRSFLPFVNSIKKTTVTRTFYRHPLIQNLYRTERRLPTYIPARNFALAVMDLYGSDLLRGATPAPALQQQQQQAQGNPQPAAGNPNNLPEDLRKCVASLVTAANGNAEQARVNIESWFNSSMDRVSGWYKTRTQLMLFAIGAMITVLVNVDSMQLFQGLSHSKNLEAIVSAAGAAAAKPLPSGQDQQAQITSAMGQLNSLDLPIGWVSEKDQSIKGAVMHDRIPPAWSSVWAKVPYLHTAPAVCSGNVKDPCGNPFGWMGYLFTMHWLGWLITAAAVSLGAPFWFDTLNRFIVVRSTVKPKEKSSDEGSKDRSKS